MILHFITIVLIHCTLTSCIIFTRLFHLFYMYSTGDCWCPV